MQSMISGVNTCLTCMFRMRKLLSASIAAMQVPLFIEEGEEIKVDTREAKYLSRAGQ
jgi:Elongation factor P, C-terminal